MSTLFSTLQGSIASRYFGVLLLALSTLLVACGAGTSQPAAEANGTTCPSTSALHLSFAVLQNAAGQYVAPSIDGALAAAASVGSIPIDLRFFIVNAPGTDSYPISGYSWVIVYQQQNNANKGWALANLFWWMIHDGQRYAESLKYAMLPDIMVTKSETQIRLMTCGSGHAPCYRG
jgi:phosphate transport system substrate-binding protein